jgi:glycine cleavage system H protein
MAIERRYSREHTWVERAPASEGQAGALLVGLTAHAVERLGTLRSLQLRAAPGEALAAGETFGSVESDKAVVDLYTPVGGRVLAVHEALAHAPERLHDDCYHDGWLLRIEAGDSGERGEFSQLLDAAAYSELLKTRAADL